MGTTFWICQTFVLYKVSNINFHLIQNLYKATKKEKLVLDNQAHIEYTIDDNDRNKSDISITENVLNWCE